MRGVKYIILRIKPPVSALRIPRHIDDMPCDLRLDTAHFTSQSAYYEVIFLMQFVPLGLNQTFPKSIWAFLLITHFHRFSNSSLFGACAGARLARVFSLFSI